MALSTTVTSVSHKPMGVDATRFDVCHGFTDFVYAYHITILYVLILSSIMVLTKVELQPGELIF